MTGLITNLNTHAQAIGIRRCACSAAKDFCCFARADFETLLRMRRLLRSCCWACARRLLRSCCCASADFWDPAAAHAQTSDTCCCACADFRDTVAHAHSLKILMLRMHRLQRSCRCACAHFRDPAAAHAYTSEILLLPIRQRYFSAHAQIY